MEESSEKTVNNNCENNAAGADADSDGDNWKVSRVIPFVFCPLGECVIWGDHGRRKECAVINARQKEGRFDSLSKKST